LVSVSFGGDFNCNKRVVNASNTYSIISIVTLNYINCNSENFVQKGADTKRLADAEVKQLALLSKHQLFSRLN